MKTKILVLLGVVSLFAACDQDIDFPYDGKGRVHFKHFTSGTGGARVPIKSETFSFGFSPDEVTEDTARIIVEFLGDTTDYDRFYNVSVFPDSTTAEAGVHYKPFEKTQKIRAGAWQDTLKIVIYRKELSKSFNDPVDYRLELALEPSDDFDLGLREGLVKTLYMNDYLSKPVWWDDPTRSLSYYHPKKWRILISFHEDYANAASCPFNTNNDGRVYQAGLRTYLSSNVVLDDETGMRLFMTTMEPYDP